MTYPSGYWSVYENQRKFVDELGRKLQIREPKDWGSVTYKQFCSFGGGTLLKRYRSSVMLALKGIYTGLDVFIIFLLEIEIPWNAKWFQAARYPRDYFESPGNQRVFLDQLSSTYKLTSISDWRRITMSLIKNHGGKVFLFYFVFTSQ